MISSILKPLSDKDCELSLWVNGKAFTGPPISLIFIVQPVNPCYWVGYHTWKAVLADDVAVGKADVSFESRCLYKNESFYLAR